MNAEIIERYQARKYGRPKLIKRSVETWLHARRKKGEFGNDYVEEFIGKSVDINKVFEANDLDPAPWNVTHEVGKFLWEKTLKIMGVANAGEEHQVLAIMNLGNKEQLQDFLDGIDAGRFTIHPAFMINPGQTLNFEV